MQLDKWSANNFELLLSNEIHNQDKSFTLPTVVSTLGLKWRPESDQFCFSVSPSPAEEPVTKRKILSEVARLFDPMGWLDPVIVKAKARQALLKLVQQESFKSDFDRLKSKQVLSSKSSLLRINPFIGQDGLLRVFGRLQHAVLSYGERHPVILPKDSFATKLLVEEAHEITLHGGAQLVSSYLHRPYWIIQGGLLVHGVVRSCTKCVRLAARNENQLMAPTTGQSIKALLSNWTGLRWTNSCANVTRERTKIL